MDTIVINIKHLHLTPSDTYQYIGRPKRNGETDPNKHFGNPFSHLKYANHVVLLPTREECIQAFRDWLDGTAWRDTEQIRRQWILDNLHTLKGKMLGCWCKPYACHGDTYIDLINKLS